MRLPFLALLVACLMAAQPGGLWQVVAEDAANDTNPCRGLLKNPIQLPPLLPADHRAVIIWMEVSGLFETFVVKEAYDRTARTYLLEYYSGSNEMVERMLFNVDMDYLISYNDETCSTLPASKSAYFYKQIPFMKWLDMTELPNPTNGLRNFIGPASLFDALMGNSRDYTKGPWQEKCQIDRQIPCDRYRMCNAFRVPIDFYFSKQGQSMFGRRESVPIRATVNSINVEVLNIVVTKDPLDLYVPTGLSCELPQQTFPRAEALEFEAEVVMTGRDLDQTYISQLSGLYSASLHDHDHHHPDHSGLYSFTYSTWRVNDVVGHNFTAYVHERVIYDIDHHLFYVHTYELDPTKVGVYKGVCEKLGFSTKFTAQFPLVRYGSLDLEKLFIATPKTNDTAGIYVAYLGQNKIRNIESSVYEVTYNNYDMGIVKLEKLVVSHHLADDWPLAVEIHGFDKDGILFSATIHIAMSNRELVDLNKKLSIEDCYNSPDKSEFRWFQIGFELLQRDQMPLLLAAQHKIKEAFLKEMYTRFELLPMRVPHVTVSFVNEQVRINTLLLERPDIESQFTEYATTDIAEPSMQLGITSLTGCLVACESMRLHECRAVSYCGSICAVTNATNPSTKKNTRHDLECVLFERKDHHTIPVSAQVLRDIRDTIESTDSKKALQVSFELVDGPTKMNPTLRADTFDDTHNFESAFHFEKGRIPLLEVAFNIAAPRMRYEAFPNGPRNLGSFSINECTAACQNRPECQSFSYCDNNRECVISESHRVEGSYSSDDYHCVIYQKKYVDRFNRFPGLTIKGGQGKAVEVANVDGCARSCFADPACKSFDYCQTAKSCLIFEDHIADTNGDPNIMPDCVHYSKRYLYDYKKKLNSQAGDTNVLAEIRDTSQEECAKRCSEWSDAVTVCLSFDFCNSSSIGRGTCLLRTMSASNGNVESSPTCDFFYFASARPLVTSAHGAGAAFGMSLLMIGVGVGVGVGIAIVLKRRLQS